MTIREAIVRTDGLKHNTYTDGEKVKWLAVLDGMVKRLIIDTHEGGGNVFYTSYDAQTSPELELLVPPPFDEIYLRWLEAQIDYANGEYHKYNNSIAMYQALWDAYRNHYNRRAMPMATAIRYY